MKRGMAIRKKISRAIFVLAILIFGLFDEGAAQIFSPPDFAAIELQAERLKSSDAETRRDAAHQLRLMENAVAARVAMSALNDGAEIVRATAAEAAAFLPDEEAAQFLAPLLFAEKTKKKSKPKFREESEFVRREAASALGEARSKTAVPALIETLQNDTEFSVRSAAAVALGKIGDERAVDALSQVLLAPKLKKSKKKELFTLEEFLRRSAARSLGQIRHKRAVPALIQALRDVSNVDDVRREAAFALGLIADKSATEVLQENLNAKDYLLAEISKTALQRIRNQESGVRSQF